MLQEKLTICRLASAKTARNAKNSFSRTFKGETTLDDPNLLHKAHNNDLQSLGEDSKENTKSSLSIRFV
jgi:hypothetical protein